MSISISIITLANSFSQNYEELGVKFQLADSLITFENIDKKFKTIKIKEKDSTDFGIIELKINYEIEGDVTESHRLYTKNGLIEIEILSDKIKKQITVDRKSKLNH